jgi:hypothetical protein
MNSSRLHLVTVSVEQPEPERCFLKNSTLTAGAEKVGLLAVKRKPGAEAHCKQGTFGTTEVAP